MQNKEDNKLQLKSHLCIPWVLMDSSSRPDGQATYILTSALQLGKPQLETNPSEVRHEPRIGTLVSCRLAPKGSLSSRQVSWRLHSTGWLSICLRTKPLREPWNIKGLLSSAVSQR